MSPLLKHIPSRGSKSCSGAGREALRRFQIGTGRFKKPDIAGGMEVRRVTMAEAGTGVLFLGQTSHSPVHQSMGVGGVTPELGLITRGFLFSGLQNGTRQDFAQEIVAQCGPAPMSGCSIDLSGTCVSPSFFAQDSVLNTTCVTADTARTFDTTLNRYWESMHGADI